MAHSILVIEDDEAVRAYLKETLVDNGYSVNTATDGIEAMNKIKKTAPDLVLLDLGLPKMRGEAVCKEIKKTHSSLPVIILTAQNTTNTLVKSLDLGADDYVSKPFEIDEILARISARLRVNKPADNKLVVGDLSLDMSKIEVKRGNKLIQLTPQEFKLLSYLMNNKGTVLTRAMILDRLWLYSPDIDTRVVDVYVGYLRKKIDNGHAKKLIHSVRGFGYSIHE